MTSSTGRVENTRFIQKTYLLSSRHGPAAVVDGASLHGSRNSKFSHGLFGLISTGLQDLCSIQEESDKPRRVAAVQRRETLLQPTLLASANGTSQTRKLWILKQQETQRCQENHDRHHHVHEVSDRPTFAVKADGAVADGLERRLPEAGVGFGFRNRAQLQLPFQ